MIKKNVKVIVLSVLALCVLAICTSAVSYNVPEQSVLLLQFGKVVEVKNEPGIYFKIPLVQKAKKIYTGERLYDIPVSDVITSDKKTMIADCYITWKIDNPQVYYQSLASEAATQGVIDVAVYNAMKTEISSTKQEEIISGKDGTLADNILKRLNLSKNGISIIKVEMKQMDLPDDNKDSVYERMISERGVIEAEYTAKGKKEAANIRSATDSEVRTKISDAQVEAANTEAEGDKEYFKRLAEAYGASAERKEFYNFIMGLDAMKESLANGGTIAIDQESPLYSILNNQ